MHRFGWILSGVLAIALVLSFIVFRQVVQGYESRASGFSEEEVAFYKSNKESIETLVELVNFKTGKLKYAAVDPEFLKKSIDIYGDVQKIQSTLGDLGFRSDGKESSSMFNVYRAFDAKMLSARFLRASGDKETAKALLLSALSDTNIEIYSCRNAPEATSFSSYVLPVELLELLQDSPYSAEVIMEDGFSGAKYPNTEQMVRVGVGKNFAPGC
ncbi:MAG: hypothetical protein Q7S63_01510 [bacterium]|nr:hypothetical protein [bacterium]